MEYKQLFLQKIIFEARYNLRYGYLDKSGAIRTKIESELDGWHDYTDNIESLGLRMANEKENILFNFNPDSLNLTQDNIKNLDYQNFITYTKKIINIVSDTLGFKEYLRFGLRYWFINPVDSADTYRKILSDSGVFHDNKEVESLFGMKIKDKGITITLEEGGKGHRIALAMAYGVNTGSIESEPSSASSEKQLSEETSPRVGILLDMDNYISNPQENNLNSFLDETIELSKNKVIKLIGGG